MHDPKDVIDVAKDIIVTDEKILRQRSEKITKEQAEETKIFERLEAVLGESQRGVGLSAIQIGVPVKAFVLRDLQDETVFHRFLNPEVIKAEKPQIIEGEGCLSIPKKVYNTIRCRHFKIKDDLHEGGVVLTDIEAVAAQHEIDHLEGVLVSDRHYEPPKQETVVMPPKTGRNEKCPCESGKKYKKCCLNRCGRTYYPEKEKK